MIARDDSENLTHYGVKGMKWRQANHARGKNGRGYDTVGGTEYTHGSGAGVPSNVQIVSQISKKKTKHGVNTIDDGVVDRNTYRTSAAENKTWDKQPATRALNTKLHKNTNMVKTSRFVKSGEEIQKIIRSKRRYKASRAGMPSYIKR